MKVTFPNSPLQGNSSGEQALANFGNHAKASLSLCNTLHTQLSYLKTAGQGRGGGWVHGIPWQSSDQDSMLPSQGAWV